MNDDQLRAILKKSPVHNRLPIAMENKVVKWRERHQSLSYYRVSKKLGQLENQTVLGRSLKILVVVSVLVLSFLTVAAQSRFDQWTTDDGLPQDSVLSIVKTRDGYLWAGTYEGLARFDGANFTVFDRVNTPQIESNFVRALLEDRAGNLWVGIDGGGMLRRSGDKFTHYSTADALASNNIISLFEDRAGNLWIGTDDNGLSVLRDGQITSFSEPDGLPGKQIFAFAEDDQEGLWIGTNGGLARFKDGKFAAFSEKAGLKRNIVRTLNWDQANGLWIGIGDDGLQLLKNGRVVDFEGKNRLVGETVQSLAEDDSGTLWIGTEQRGLCRLKNKNLTCEADDGGGLNDENIQTLYRDTDGTIWVGGYKTGLSRIKRERFRAFSKADGLQEDDVRGIYEDRAGNLWFGTNAAIYRLTEGVLKRYSAAETFQNGAPTIAEDSRGTLWFGRNGISKYENGKFSKFSTEDGLLNNSIFAALGDREGNLWIGTPGGLNLLRDGHFSSFTKRDGLVDNFIISLFEDRAGAIWVGTRNGLSRFQNGKFTNWTTADGLASNHILSFYEEDAGALWIGTSGGGLNRYKDGKFSTITSRDGLYDNLAFVILNDGYGNLWMSGNRGVYRAELQQLNDFADGKISLVTSYAYGTADGMLSRECNGASPAGWKTRDGTLWFPTVRGLVSVNPQPFDGEPPTVIIERAEIDRRIQPINELVELSPSQENLEIKYTAISWQRPQQIKFKYRLEGLDNEWINAETRRTAYYSHLPAGEYTFHVIADNGEGIWNEIGKSLQIKVLPPFYRTWWFYILSFALVFGVLFAVVRYRIAQVEKARRMQEDFSRKLLASQENERQRIAAELHDTLGQSLLIIKNRVALAQTDIDEKETVEEQLGELSQSAAAAIDECREIAYNLRPYQISRFGLSKTLAGIFRRIEEITPISVTTQIDDVDDLLNAEAEINVYRIVQECVNNIIKHSEATEALLAIKRNGDEIVILIEDNGRGFVLRDEAKKAGKNGGFGLIGIAERVKMLDGVYEIESEIGSGANIRIKLNRKFQNNDK